ncbi:MAG: methyltransferase domain-containing protein [Nanoarchaeota archaeon]
MRKIDLCGGHGKPTGYESVDLKNSDIVADLNNQWPFKDGEVGLFRAHDALEHLKNPIHTMKEIYRCLSPKGWLLSLTPSTDGRGAFCDPTHVSFWNSFSLRYYTHKLQAQYIDTPVKFQLNRIKDFFPSEYHKFHNIVYVKADLLKFSGRTPGLIEI